MRVETLKDGTRVVVRAIRPEDKSQLHEGFQRLSERSRMQRFCAHKRDLSERELAYLTEVDGYNHVAIGAQVLENGALHSCGGVARFVRLVPGGPVAELALAVSDEMQGKGLGTLLVHRLSEIALRLGVTRFRCVMLDENRAMERLVARIDPYYRVLRTTLGTRELELRPNPGRTADVTMPFRAIKRDAREHLSHEARP